MNSNYKINSTKINTILTIIFCLMISLVSAADLEIEDESELNFEVDYSSLDEDEETITLSHTFTIKNEGDEEENISISIDNVNSVFTVEFSDSNDASFILSENDEKEIELTIVADITETEEYGDITNVFEIKLTSNTSDDETFKFDSYIKPMLDVKKIEFTIGSKKSSNFDEDDSNDDEIDFTAEPGEKITLFFEINNEFDDKFEDGTFDVDIEITLDNSYFGKDINEDLSFELKSGEKTGEENEDYSITFEVPKYARAKNNYELTINFKVEDENDVELEVEWIAQIEVERDENDVRIDNIKFSSDTVKCGDPVYMFITSTNYGSEDQPHSEVIIEDLNLGIDDNEEFELGYGYEEDENTHTTQFEFNVPNNLEEGSYDILVKLYYDYNKIGYQTYQTLEIECGEDLIVIEEVVEEITSDLIESGVVVTETIETTTGNVDTSITTESHQVINTIEKSYSKEDFEIALTIVFIVLIIMSVISLLAVLFVRSKKR